MILIGAFLLGAMVNIAVAWRMAYRPQPYPLDAVTYISAETGPLWMYQQREAGGAVRRDATAVSRWAAGRSNAIPVRPPPSWSALAAPPVEGDEDKQIIEEEFGWPLASLSYAIVSAAGGRRLFGLIPAHAIVLNQPHPHDRNRSLALPLHPLWRGFLINTFLFAVAILPLLVLTDFGVRFVFSWRRRRWLRKGRCVRCGYNLRGKFAEGCPECGWNRSQPSHRSDI